MTIYVSTADADAEEIVEQLLLAQVWLIGCNATDPDDSRTYTPKTVFLYKLQEHGTPAFVEHDISLSIDGWHKPYRLHEPLIQPIANKKALAHIIKAIVEKFEVIILEDGLVDRSRTYGKIGTERADMVVRRGD